MKVIIALIALTALLQLVFSQNIVIKRECNRVVEISPELSAHPGTIYFKNDRGELEFYGRTVEPTSALLSKDITHEITDERCYIFGTCYIAGYIEFRDKIFFSPFQSRPDKKHRIYVGNAEGTSGQYYSLNRGITTLGSITSKLRSGDKLSIICV